MSEVEVGSQRPPLGGMRHVALFVTEFAACEQFYVEVLGMQIEWRPDADNLYLCSGCDNVALHRAQEPISPDNQRLDHIGFIVDDIDDVDRWHQHLLDHNVVISMAPKTHRDGARSLYCRDPDGTHVQLIYHPPISGQVFSA